MFPCLLSTILSLAFAAFAGAHTLGVHPNVTPLTNYTGHAFPRQSASSDSKAFVPRGIYVNARVAGSARMQTLVERLVAAGGNSVVFDIKDRPGDLSYPSEVPLGAR